MVSRMEVWFEEALQVPYAKLSKILDFLQSPVKQIFRPIPVGSAITLVLSL